MKTSAIGIILALMGPAMLLSQTTSINSLPPGWVDGSKNPELIPDSAAYRLVFMSLRPPESTDPKGLTRQTAALAAIGLSSAGVEVLKQQMATFASAYKALKAQGAPAEPAGAATLSSQIVTLVLSTRSALIQQLVSDDAAKIGAYVQAAKSRMFVRP